MIVAAIIAVLVYFLYVRPLLERQGMMMPGGGGGGGVNMPGSGGGAS